MCNLYRLDTPAKTIADVFDAAMETQFNAGEGEVYPGGQGLVVRERDGRRVLNQATWGFPLRLKSMRAGTKPKPVNNIADLNGYLWRFIATKPENRCLIPLTGFCEAEGEKGSKTRTWFGVKDRPVFAWAGMWRMSEEWGPVYSGLMTSCNGVVAPVHDRMPVLLHEEDYEQWLRGSLDDVLGFQGRCFPDELTTIERTPEPWFRRKTPSPDTAMLA